VFHKAFAAALILLHASVLAQSEPAPAEVVAGEAIADPAAGEQAQLRAAYHFAVPLYTMAQARNAAPALNSFAYQQSPDDPRSLGLSLQNVDLLHAVAWVDLGAGPVVLAMPPLAGRYHSVAVANMQTDLLALLGTRTGSQGGRFALIGPGYQGPVPEGTTPLRLSCRDCRLIARVLVKGADDLDAARAALAGITLESEPQPNVPIGETPDVPSGATFIATAMAVIARAGDGSSLAQKAAQLPALGFDSALWQKNFPALYREHEESLPAATDKVNGWTYPRFALTDAGADDAYRAQTASQTDALPRVEAMELETREDAAGTPLNGTQAYRLRLPYNLPIGGFWSVSMYQIGKDGSRRFVENPLSRFAVGDRSSHLRAERDGTTDLFIQTGRPQGERSVNWLPAPAGPFALVFRAYLPKAEMLDGSFRLPPVKQSDPVP
jgi:hypothetical protein